MDPGRISLAAERNSTAGTLRTPAPARRIRSPLCRGDGNSAIGPAPGDRVVFHREPAGRWAGPWWAGPRRAGVRPGWALRVPPVRPLNPGVVYLPTLVNC